MEGKFQTSFIPKKSFTPVPSHRSSSNTTSVFTLTAGIIFITILALAIGVFSYTLYLEHVNAQSKLDLKAALDNLQPSVIKTLDRTNSRIVSAQQLLGQHLSPSKIFAFLSLSTLNDVRFSKFSYDDTDSSKVKITMDGQARNFSDVALQANEFMKPDYKNMIHDQVFSNLGLDASGNVSFNFTATVDSKAFLYRPDTVLPPVTVSNSPAQTIPAASSGVASSSVQTTPNNP